MSRGKQGPLYIIARPLFAQAIVDAFEMGKGSKATKSEIRDITKFKDMKNYFTPVGTLRSFSNALERIYKRRYNVIEEK